MKKALTAGGLCALLAAGVADLGAAVLVPADVVELTKAARAVARGQVVGLETRWADGRRRIETVVTIEVAEYYKGDLGTRVTIRVPGGDLGRYRTLMPGAPSFREGEHVVLFLGAQPPALPYVLGLSQGVFRLVRDGASGRAVVIPPPLVAAALGPEHIRRGDPGRRPPTVDEFGSDLRAIVAGEWPRSGRPDSRERPRVPPAAVKTQVGQ
jgi:hypothetical protein